MKKAAWFPTQNVDHTTLQAVAFHRYRLIRDIDLNIELDVIQNKLAELHRKLEIMQTPGISAKAHNNLMDDVKKQLEILLDENSNLILLAGKLKWLAGEVLNDD